MEASCVAMQANQELQVSVYVLACKPWRLMNLSDQPQRQRDQPCSNFFHQLSGSGRSIIASAAASIVGRQEPHLLLQQAYLGLNQDLQVHLHVFHHMD